MSELRRFVKIKCQFEGFHAYRDAPEEVSFLRNRHRHMFHVTVKIAVEHDDRELEFFIEQAYIKSLFSDESERNNQSCEMMCCYVIDKLNERYDSSRNLVVEVSEDDENSGIVEFYK